MKLNTPLTATGDNDAARNAVARVPRRLAPQVIRIPVNHNAGSTQVKQRMMALPRKRQFGQNGLKPPGTILCDNQIWQVARMMLAAISVVRLSSGIEMRSGAFKCLPFTACSFVHMDSMGARAQSVYGNDDVDVLSGWTKSRRPDSAAFRITDLCNRAANSGRAAPAFQPRHQQTNQPCDRMYSHVAGM